MCCLIEIGSKSKFIETCLKHQTTRVQNQTFDKKYQFCCPGHENFLVDFELPHKDVKKHHKNPTNVHNCKIYHAKHATRFVSLFFFNQPKQCSAERLDTP